MALGDTSILDRLNTAERDVLMLLAQGHTAKSIASLRGVTVAGVNERLRSARRKTNVGSSRELARLVTAHENRDDFIDLAEAVPAALHRQTPPTPRGGRLKRWKYPMIATGLVAVAVAVLAQQPSQTAQTGVTPPSALSESLSRTFEADRDRPDAGELHREANGPKDPDWSETAETRMRDYFRRVPAVANDVGDVGITCSARVCEYIATTRSGLALDRPGGVMTELNAHALGGAEALNMDMAIQGVSTTNDGKSLIFYSYWRRR